MPGQMLPAYARPAKPYAGQRADSRILGGRMSLRVLGSLAAPAACGPSSPPPANMPPLGRGLCNETTCLHSLRLKAYLKGP